MAEGGFDMDFGRDEQQEVREEEDDDDAVFDEEIDPNLDGLTQETLLSEDQRSDLRELKQELLKQKLNAFYSDVEEKTGHRPAIDLDPNNFRLKKGGRLEAKLKRSWVELTNEKNPRKFKGLNTIQRETNAEFIRL